ncbi:hypothetical protein C0Q70_20496 [Pomacea canaliculata]|uniref:5-formyltetrahydrofolate cyclo-ligase n=1 Tax=Pomacea canaliculata TaxID=400727 RepID=A0A2T7NFU6_POMCA|nr:5-formyltetrahydrofolate cyclo-ligase-like [Pomacea canaliculata]PVD20002.1 hypothetical protein C0Q70_20496 [Pomacea canaliculata]
MATLRQAKATLRQEMKQKLANITKEEKDRQSDIVIKKVLQSPIFASSQRLSLFLNMPDEINTFPILQAAMAAKKACFIPHYQGPVMKMVHLVSLEDYYNLPLTKWNIKQPADNDLRPDAVDTGGLDLILMPGLAFSRQGARLGRGKGYYDSYLRRCHDSGVTPRTMALSFREQLVDHVPTGEHDFLVQEVVWATEEM